MAPMMSQMMTTTAPIDGPLPISTSSGGMQPPSTPTGRSLTSRRFGGLRRTDGDAFGADGYPTTGGQTSQMPALKAVDPRGSPRRAGSELDKLMMARLDGW